VTIDWATAQGRRASLLVNTASQAGSRQ